MCSHIPSLATQYLAMITCSGVGCQGWSCLKSSSLPHPGFRSPTSRFVKHVDPPQLLSVLIFLRLRYRILCWYTVQVWAARAGPVEGLPHYHPRTSPPHPDFVKHLNLLELLFIPLFLRLRHRILGGYLVQVWAGPAASLPASPHPGLHSSSPRLLKHLDPPQLLLNPIFLRFRH